MIYFPKSDDTRCLKILIKKDIIEYNGKDKSLRLGLVFRKGTAAGNSRDYDFSYQYDFITFDDNCIYQNDEQISLAQLILHIVIHSKDLDDTVREIIESRGFKLVPVLMGESKPVYHEGENFDTIDLQYPSYEVVTETEAAEIETALKK